VSALPSGSSLPPKGAGLRGRRGPFRIGSSGGRCSLYAGGVIGCTALRSLFPSSGRFGPPPEMPRRALVAVVPQSARARLYSFCLRGANQLMAIACRSPPPTPAQARQRVAALDRGQPRPLRGADALAGQPAGFSDSAACSFIRVSELQRVARNGAEGAHPLQVNASIVPAAKRSNVV
jgi:hypothetical protein